MAFKKYKEDVTAADIKEQLSRVARDLAHSLELGDELNQQWEAYKQGKSDGDIETALSISATELTDIKQAFTSLRDMYAIVGGDDTVTIPTGVNTFLRRLREFG